MSARACLTCGSPLPSGTFALLVGNDHLCRPCLQDGRLRDALRIVEAKNLTHTLTHQGDQP